MAKKWPKNSSLDPVSQTSEGPRLETKLYVSTWNTIHFKSTRFAHS